MWSFAMYRLLIDRVFSIELIRAKLFGDVIMHSRLTFPLFASSEVLLQLHLGTRRHSADAIWHFPRAKT